MADVADAVATFENFVKASSIIKIGRMKRQAARRKCAANIHIYIERERQTERQRDRERERVKGE